jgi:Spy/CpxP family protein refolding chaperone
MTSRIALITLLTAALSAGGLMANEATASSHRQRTRVNFVDRMSTALNLTDQQKQEAKTIFMSEREGARSVRQELRQQRRTVESAIQAGKPAAEVQQIAKNEGPALASLAGMRAAAFAKFYAVLTPAQQQKLAGLHQEWRQHHAAQEHNNSAPRG